MRVLLDENFPVQLRRRLRSAGLDADHVIALGIRGMSDVEIRRLLRERETLFLTQDTEFVHDPPGPPTVVIVSRIPQDWSITRRVEIWFAAVADYLDRRPDGNLFELDADGVLAPWRIIE